MINEQKVSDYDSFIDLFQKLSSSSERLLVLYCAALDEAGNSWCPDCREALPVINEAIEGAKGNANVTINYIFVSIERPFWKDLTNMYRSDANLKVNEIPTLVWYESGKEKQRLGEIACKNSELVLPYFKKE